MTEYSATQENTAVDNGLRERPYTHLFEETKPKLAWHVLWTRSNCERQVFDQLCAKGYEVFLPTIDQWSGEGSDRRCCQVPMFKGYLFLHHAVDKYDYLDICNTRGLVTVLGARWDRLAYVPESEIEAIRLAVLSGMRTTPYPFLEEGDRVRFSRGSLAGAEGILVKNQPENGLFIISVNLLRRSIAVEVNCTDVVPA